MCHHCIADKATTSAAPAKAKAKGRKAKGPQQGLKLRQKFNAPVLKTKAEPWTHERLIHAVYAEALRLRTLTADDKAKLARIKLTYGAGPDGVRGITYFKLWSNIAPGRGDPAKSETVPFVAICATGQESLIQTIGTTLHELGHVLAGWEAAHGPEWHAACARLGLLNIQAAGTRYAWDNFTEAQGFQATLRALKAPQDGQPRAFAAPAAPGTPAALLGPAVKVKPCGAGIGTKGGKSRGAGSGSRLVLWLCGCQDAPKVRAARSAALDATCNKCKVKLAPQPEAASD